MITSRALFSACFWSCRYSQPAYCFSFSPTHYCSLSCLMSVDEFASNLRVRFSYLVSEWPGLCWERCFCWYCDMLYMMLYFVLVLSFPTFSPSIVIPLTPVFL